MCTPELPPRLASRDDPIQASRPAPCGAYFQPNGRAAIVVAPPPSPVDPHRVEDLANIADRYAFEGLATGPDGAIELRGIDPEVISEVIEAIRASGAC